MLIRVRRAYLGLECLRLRASGVRRCWTRLIGLPLLLAAFAPLWLWRIGVAPKNRKSTINDCNLICGRLAEQPKKLSVNFSNRNLIYSGHVEKQMKPSPDFKSLSLIRHFLPTRSSSAIYPHCAQE